MNSFKVYILVLILCVGQSTLSQESSKERERAAALQQEINFNLMIEADSGDLEKVKILIEAGANPNAAAWTGITPLMYAAQAGHYKVAREFLLHKVDVNAESRTKLTALHYAAINNHDSIAELLILNGANPHPVNLSGVSPLHYASRYGYEFMTYLLLYYGAHIDSTDRYGNTPLMASIYSGAFSTADYLLINWADVDKPDHNGYTPLMVAAQFNDTSMIRLLTDYGSDIYRETQNGVTALALAMDMSADDAILILLEKGASTKELHPKLSYADLALRNGYKDISQFLHKLGSPLSRKPELTSIIPYTGFIINTNDLYFLLGTSTHIAHYGMIASVDFGIRPFFKAVLIDKEYASYQFFEKRYMASISLGKELARIHLLGKSHLKLSVGLSFIGTWGHYAIISDVFRPANHYLLTPKVEVSYRRNNLYYAANGYVLLMDQLRHQPLSFSFSIGYIFDRSIIRIRPKRIEW